MFLALSGSVCGVCLVKILILEGNTKTMTHFLYSYVSPTPNRANGCYMKLSYGCEDPVLKSFPIYVSLSMPMLYKRLLSLDMENPSVTFQLPSPFLPFSHLSRSY